MTPEKHLKAKAALEGAQALLEPAWRNVVPVLAELTVLARDGYASRTPGNGDPAGGSGGISDPVSRSALAPDEASDHIETISGLCEAILWRTTLLTDALQPWVDLLARRPAKTPSDRGLAKCANPHGCPDDGWAVRSGRCDTCAQYRYRHQGMDRRTRDDRAA